VGESPQRLRAHPWRVFTEEDAQIRREITLHALRRYFVTADSVVCPVARMRALTCTQSRRASMAPYIGLVDSDVRTEFKRVTAEPWF
jgi:hypothetical protein